MIESTAVIMKQKKVTLPAIIASALLLVSCVVTLNREHMLFRIEDIFYQSWMIDENIKGTDVVVTLRDADPDLEVISIVYSGIKVPVSKTAEGGRMIIRGVINPGLSLTEPNLYETTDLSDRIIYSYKGEESFYPLVNIRRENMKYYKR
ncbi:MAG TPA: hypothetical protein VMW76_05895 [Bacteroidales bacterium]|nr:hypothetical protein [Bacteroidales bacterium]